ncbi:MAG: prephenate dehydrogenase [Bacteroidales bacterium]
MIVTIVGLGLIGCSLAKDIRNTMRISHLIGVDVNDKHCKMAEELKIVDQIMSLENALTEADLVIVSTPVDVTMKILPSILDFVDANTTVMDVGSTKSEICKALAKHGKRKNYVATHPMSGTENSGPSAAIENLFVDKIAIICDHESTAPQHLALVEKIYGGIGCKIAYMSADEQDHTTAYVSHLPHALAYILANAVLNNEERKVIVDLASGGFRSAARLAKTTASMWVPIFEQNRKYVSEALGKYLNLLAEFKSVLDNNDYKKLSDIITDASTIRDVLDGDASDMIKNEEKIIKLYNK